MGKMRKNEKQALVRTLTEEFGGCTMAIFTHFAALSVKEMEKLRKQVRLKKGRVRVTKNTFLRKVLDNVGQAELFAKIERETFVVWSNDADEIDLVKSLIQFRESIGKISLKAAVIHGRVFGADDLESLGRLPSKKLLQAKIVMTLRMPALRIVNAVKYPMGKLVNIVYQLKDKKESGNE